MGGRSASFWNVPLPVKSQDPVSLGQRCSMEKLRKGAGNSRVEFSSHCGEQVVCLPHALLLTESWLIRTVAAILLAMGTLASVVVVLWLCRYGSFLSQILRILVLCFLNCKLLNKSSVFRGLLRAPSGGNIETLKQEK